MPKPKKSRGRELESILLVLLLFHETFRKGHDSLTNTQIHKFLFLSEREMWRRKILASGLRFIKMPRGPWSSDIKRALEFLTNANLITVSKVPTQKGDDAILTSLTEDGSFISHLAVERMKGSPDTDILKALRSVIDEYGHLSSDELAEITHGMENLVTGKLIDDIEFQKYIQIPRKESKADMVFKPDPDVECTLDIMLDPELRDKFAKSVESAQETPGMVLRSLDDLEAL